MNFSFIKENENKAALSDVNFALYKGKAGKVLTAENTDPLHADTYWDMDTPVGTAISAPDGKVEFSQLSSGSYLLMETKTQIGYQLPTGQWVIEVNQGTNTITIKAHGDPLPPAFYTTGSGTEMVYHLPNYKQFVMPKAGKAAALLNTVLGLAILGCSMGDLIRPEKRRR